RPRPLVRSYRGAREPVRLSEPVAEGLRALSRREGATLFMTLLAAWLVLLLRYSGQADLCVGVPVAGRRNAEVEGLIGFFVNTLVVRTELGGGPTFSEALQRVRQACLGAYAHQDIPFERLVEELQPERSLSHHPLFQVMFSFQNMPASEPGAPAGLRLDYERIETVMTKFDLTLSGWENGDRFQTAIEYSTDLYDACTIRSMIVHFQSLVTSVVDAPHWKITEIPLLAEAEQH